MKKILLLSVIALLCLSLVACNQDIPEDEHVHDFSECVVAPEFLAEEATCQFPASYCYSCECGEMDLEHFFTHGEPLAHNFEGGICTECGEDDPEHSEDGGIDLPVIPV